MSLKDHASDGRCGQLSCYILRYVASEEASSGIDLGPRGAVARNAFHLVLGQAITTALAIVLSAALGRSLGAADFGLYFLISAGSTFAYVVVDWGQQFYVIREVARWPERAGRLLGSALGLRAAGGALIAIPAGLVMWALGYDARTCLFSIAFIAASLPFALAQGYSMVFRGRDRMGLAASVSVVNKALVLAAVLGALILGAGLPGVVGAQAVGGIGALAIAAWLHSRLSAGEIRFSARTAVEVVKGGSAIVIMMVAVSVQPYLDALILSRLVPAEAVGWYGAARNVMGTLLAPSLIIGVAAYPHLSRAAGELRAFNGEVRATLRPMLFLGALGAVGTYLFADTVIRLVYGERHFGPAAAILRIFAPALFLLFIDVLFANALTALGRSSAFSLVKVASVVLGITIDLVLVPLFQRRTGNGGIGIVVASLASEVAVFAGAALLMPSGSLRGAVAMDVLRAVGCGAATALVFHWLPALPLYAGIPACIAAFGLCALAAGLIRRSDVLIFTAMARRAGPLAGGARAA